MYIEKITLIFMEPCTTGHGRIKIRAQLSRNINFLLPYLNSEIKTGIYHTSVPNFSFKYKCHIITLQDDKLSVTQVESESAAFEFLDKIKDYLNHIYEKRDQIVPLTTLREKLKPLDLYQNLPKSNCGKCGSLTCLAFATKLVKNEQNLNQCPILKESKYFQNYNILSSILIEAGYLL